MRLLFIFLSIPFFTLAQMPDRQADFTTSTLPDGSVQFKAIEPPLSQIAGGGSAFYSHFWEFGDGTFSREESPVHHFEEKGTYNALLHLTAHYDDGDNPRGKERSLFADGSNTGQGAFASLFEGDEARDPAIRIISNKQAKAGEDLTLVLSYKNKGSSTTSGNLFLFFNEKTYPAPHFELMDSREHHKELRGAEMLGSIPDFEFGGYYGIGGDAAWMSPLPLRDFSNELDRQRDIYRSEVTWRFSDLEEREERNIFLSMNTTPDMLRDTSAIIHMTGLFLPDNPDQKIGEYVFEIEIVNGHDPNAIAVSDVRINYRFIQFKKLDYKVRFQNDGDGVADSITVLIEQPKNLFNAKISPREWSPECPPCNQVTDGGSCMETVEKGDSLYFIFRNIYLPGSKQKGVTDKDSTKGFVVYRIEPKRNMPKFDFKSRAHIYFDKEDAVLTNYTRTRFKAGLSPGPKVGYGFTYDEEDSGYFFMGCSFSPFKSWKAYPQIELLTGLKGQSAFQENLLPDTTILSQPNMLDTVFITNGTRLRQRGFISLDIPILIRKSLSKRFAIGAGLNSQFIFYNGTETETTRTDLYIREPLPNAPIIPLDVVRTNETNTAINDRELRVSGFLDLSFGSVRQGPNIGIRGGYPLGQKEAKPWVQLSLELKL